MSGIDTKTLAKKIRLHALRMTSLGKSAHVGSVFSMADLLAVLYGDVLRVDPANPKWDGRDRFILSKGHAAAGLYAVLAERGFFPVSKLDTHYQDGADLCGHVSHCGVPGVELSTGSLGHGLPVATGMAYAAKLDGKEHRIFVLMSDGECDEGSNWEAILFAGHHKLDHLTAVVDYNKIQSLGTTDEILTLEPFRAKWESFGWSVCEIDGHDHSQILKASQKIPLVSGKPTCILAHTVKGKGVSFMENTVLWHYRTPQGAEYQAALQELESLS